MSLEEVVANLGDPDDQQEIIQRIRHEIKRRQRRAALRVEKFCPGCRQTKDIDEFGVHSGRPDGRQGYCRACR